jgi:hypothetical protein
VGASCAKEPVSSHVSFGRVQYIKLGTLAAYSTKSYLQVCTEQKMPGVDAGVFSRACEILTKPEYVDAADLCLAKFKNMVRLKLKKRMTQIDLRE